MTTLDSICVPSTDVVAREIEGDMVIVPLAAGIGEADDELFVLNETGRAIWLMLDGRRTLSEVAAGLGDTYDASPETLASEVLGFADELLRRGILCTVV